MRSGTDSPHLDPEFNQWTRSLIEKLIPILLQNPPKAPRSLVENAAVTIGRIALVQPQLVAPHLDVFAAQWFVWIVSSSRFFVMVVQFFRCQALWEIKDNSEKDTAFRGFCAMIEINPTGIKNVCQAFSCILWLAHRLFSTSSSSAMRSQSGQVHRRSWMPNSST